MQPPSSPHFRSGLSPHRHPAEEPATHGTAASERSWHWCAGEVAHQRAAGPRAQAGAPLLRGMPPLRALADILLSPRRARVGRQRCTWPWRPRSGLWCNSSFRRGRGWTPACSMGARLCTWRRAGASAASRPPCARQVPTPCCETWRMRLPRTWLRM